MLVHVSPSEAIWIFLSSEEVFESVLLMMWSLAGCVVSSSSAQYYAHSCEVVGVVL